MKQIYFKPRQFEFCHNKTIYDYLGIRFYKKYLPTTGDVVMRWRGEKMLNKNPSGLYSELCRYEQQTRVYEGRHLIGLVGFIILALALIKPPYVTNLIIANTINLLVNIYPIFLQRYNRIRILKIINNNNWTSPYSS